MKTAQSLDKFYEDLNGRIACYKHIGCSAQGHIDQNPSVRSFNTDMTRWVRMTAVEVHEFAQLIGETYSVCESCRYESKRETA